MTTAFYSLVAENIPASEMLPSRLIAKESFTTDDSTETVYPFYHSEDGTVSSGVWECGPCRQDIPTYPVNEMMTIISGSVTLTDAGGQSRSYGRGDSLFVPKGARLTWCITEKLKKYFMTAA